MYTLYSIMKNQTKIAAPVEQIWLENNGTCSLFMN